MMVEEHYYILDYTPDYVMYFYCGFGFGGEYQGSVIYGNQPEISPELALRRSQAGPPLGLP